ncbi:hypothetical protein OXPF_15790 [Oxobacter pfennigii]|uniref:Uncharacterized protein n=1 Tax=Oxobacter pfennigii TaxID=36849 RepID=A0A0P8WBK6_9CLOT|nr:hypothetical protein [Oxobacter pfennigii]KPU45101.1 hypothetical protein OXPF_15790 [Oxobacter pfennigii]
MLISKNIFFLLIFVIGGILLQIFLSKRKSKWFGLILPMICLIFSLIVVLGNTPMYTSGELTMQQLAPDGTVIEESIIEQHKQPIMNTGTAIFQMLIVFLLYNIPTAILLIVYFACRENIRKNSQLEKMNIQDLE